MQIIWHGQSCFQIIITKGKGEYVTLLIDPLDEGITGLKPPKANTDIVIYTNREYTTKNLDKIAPDAFIVDGPGEYEVKGVFIQGMPTTLNQEGAKPKVSTLYAIEAEDIQLCHLGDLRQKELTSEQINKIGNIEILMCPIGGESVISGKESLKIMSQIEPSIVIPMNYSIPGLKVKADKLSDFLKEAGLDSVEAVPKLVIKKKDIHLQEAKIVVLTP